MRSNKVNEIMLGVVYDFGAFLTTEKGTLLTGSTHDATPMVSKIKDFLTNVELKQMILIVI